MNPFDLPPDADQQKISSIFGWKGPEEQEQRGGKDGGHRSDSDSSSTSSTSSSKPEIGANALGDIEEDYDMIPSTTCSLQPEATRDRKQMFSFPSRHVERIGKHWGPESLENLKNNLSRTTVISLYSGLGGGEIACKLLSNALDQHMGTSVPHPKNLMACDISSDCQKILNSHSEAFSHLKYAKKNETLLEAVKTKKPFFYPNYKFNSINYDIVLSNNSSQTYLLYSFTVYISGQASLHRQQLGGLSGSRCYGKTPGQDRFNQGPMHSFGC